MQPVRKVEVIRRYYWACATEEHRHQTPELAQQCIDIKHPSIQNLWTAELLAECDSRHDHGETYTAIGRDYGIKGKQMAAILRAHRPGTYTGHSDNVFRQYAVDAFRSIAAG